MNAKGHLSSKPKPWSPLAPDATALNQVQSTFECASGCRVRQSWGYHLCWNEPSVFALMLRRPARAFHLFAPPDTGTPSSCVNEILYLIKLRAACDSTQRVMDMTEAFRLSLEPFVPLPAPNKGPSTVQQRQSRVFLVAIQHFLFVYIQFFFLHSTDSGPRSARSGALLLQSLVGSSNVESQNPPPPTIAPSHPRADRLSTQK